MLFILNKTNKFMIKTNKFINSRSQLYPRVNHKTVNKFPISDLLKPLTEIPHILKESNKKLWIISISPLLWDPPDQTWAAALKSVERESSAKSAALESPHRWVALKNTGTHVLTNLWLPLT